MLNRDLLIIRYKQPFVDWVNEADPHPDGHRMTLEDVNEADAEGALQGLELHAWRRPRRVRQVYWEFYPPAGAFWAH